MKVGVRSGKYVIGELIEPKEFKKFVHKDGRLVEIIYTRHGRKVPLYTLRKKILKRYEEIGLMRPQLHYKRKLLVWADHAEILSRGELLFTIRAIYNKDIFYTNAELRETHGDIDVQEIVETPELYILGQTADSFAEKLTYTETRLEDILSLEPISIADKTFEDKLRVFIDLHGYIVSVNSAQSNAGNEFFDIRLKTSPTESAVIKIMKRTNSSISLKHLKELKSSGMPLSFTKLSKGNSDVHFFNSFKGSQIISSSEVNFSFAPNELMSLIEIKKQSAGTFDIVGCIRYLDDPEDVTSRDETMKLRDAVIFDGTEHTSLTLWGEQFCSLDENTWLSFKNVSMKYHFGQKLTTSRSTNITVGYNVSTPRPTLPDAIFENYQANINEVKGKLIKTLCCPEMKSVDVNFINTCVKCGNTITIVAGKCIISCQHCSTTMRSDKCIKQFNMEIFLDNETLKIPEDVISDFLGEDVTHLCQTAEGKEEL